MRWRLVQHLHQVLTRGARATCSYNTYSAHYKEVECFQQQVETLLFQYGVSFVFNGHVHAYERSNPVFAYELNPCAPTYVIIGDGGNVEGVRAACLMVSFPFRSLCV